MIWPEDGLCVGKAKDGDSLWWSARADEQRQAKEICAKCPVALQCLRHGEREGEPGMIYGGKLMTGRKIR